MIRAIFFDFYSVWAPDRIGYYQARADLAGPAVAKEVSDVIERYYHGQADVNYLANSFKSQLLDADIDENQFYLKASDISPEITNFMRDLHSHFLKLGILANLGTQEYELLAQFNEANQLFEAIVSPLSLEIDEPLLSSAVIASATQAIGEPLDACLLVSGNPAWLDFAASQGLQILQFEGLSGLQQSINQMVENEMPGN